jgi:murein DD-endopeptidase MepM/ murein hydrolase activator NlpD
LAGNIIVLDLGDGVHVALAHLKRRSVTVKPGQQVRQGEVVGRCGNSGNSSQPHLHFQLMDHPRQSLAAGLPFTFTATNHGSPPAPGYVPRGGETIEASPAHSGPSRRSPNPPNPPARQARRDRRSSCSTRGAQEIPHDAGRYAVRHRRSQ